MRPLALHASALSDAEYDLYTTSLRDLALVDDDDGKQPAGTSGEDAYFEKISVGVREARAWLRGRYSHVPAPVLDGILRLFSPSLGHADTLSGAEFFAVLRLVVHAESGRAVDRSLAFVQADPGKATHEQHSRSAPASQAASPAKRHADLPPPTPSRRPHPDPTQNVGPSSTRPPLKTEHNPFFPPEPPPPPPLHPSHRSESARSLTGSQHSAHNPFAQSQRQEGTAKIPPLPPRKPAPPIPAASSSSATGGSAPPPPPRPRARADRSLSPTKAPLATLPPAIPTSSSLHVHTNAHPYALSNTASPVALPPAPPLTTAPFAPPPPPKPPHHTTSALMRQSLAASKAAQSMKKAEAQLEKARVMQVLRRSSNPPVPSVHGGVEGTRAGDGEAEEEERPGVHGAQYARRTASPSRFDGSASSASGSVERGAPPLPRRRHAPQQPSPPLSASSLEQVARAAAPPPTHPDRKPVLEYNPPSAFDAVYGMTSLPASSGAGSADAPPSPGARVFRSQSLHHPSPPRTPVSMMGVGSGTAPPPPRRRRPESVQVRGTGVGTLVHAYNAHAAGTAGGSVYRRASLSATPSPTTQQDSPFYDAAEGSYSTAARSTAARSQASPTPSHPGHSHSQSQSHSASTPSSSGAARPLAALQRTLTLAGQQLAPRIDAARYKAEAGLSRRGFIPPAAGGAPGQGGETAGLMDHTHGHGHAYNGQERYGRGHGHEREPHAYKYGEDDGAPGVDAASSTSNDDEEDEDGEAWRRSRGMDVRRDPSADVRIVPLGRGRAVGRDVFADGGGADGEGYGKEYEAGGMEQDNLKWPAGAGWRPL